MTNKKSIKWTEVMKIISLLKEKSFLESELKKTKRNLKLFIFLTISNLIIMLILNILL